MRGDEIQCVLYGLILGVIVDYYYYFRKESVLQDQLDDKQRKLVCDCGYFLNKRRIKLLVKRKWGVIVGDLIIKEKM